MCLRFVFLLITRMTSWLRLSRREEAWKTAEILILRHQLAVLQRRQPRRPNLDWADRALLATLLAAIPKARRQAPRLLVTPATVLRWHRDIVRRWAARSKRGTYLIEYDVGHMRRRQFRNEKWSWYFDGEALPGYTARATAFAAAVNMSARSVVARLSLHASACLEPGSPMALRQRCPGAGAPGFRRSGGGQGRLPGRGSPGLRLSRTRAPAAAGRA